MPTRVILRALLAVVLVLPSLCALAQEQPRFSARTELVLVPVIVSDKSGAHAAGLSREQFVVREDGKQRKLAIFEEVVTRSGRWVAVPKSRTEFSNLVVTEPRPSRVTIIVIDSINTPALGQVYAREALLRFIEQAGDAGESIAIVGLNRGGIRLVHNFTTDTRLLLAAVAKLRRQQPSMQPTSLEQLESALATFETQQLFATGAPSGPGQDALADARRTAEFMQNFSDLQQRMAILRTLEGIQQIARMFAGISGRKSLIWVSGGFPFLLGDSGASARGWFSDQGLKDVFSDYERTWKLLNDAAIAVYPVDALGLAVDDPSLSGAYRMPASGGRYDVNARLLKSARDRSVALREDRLATMQTFADMTGGRAFFNRNDLDRCFREAVDDASSYYMLGYYLDRRHKKPGWHQLQVAVALKGAQMRARNGFYVADDSSKLAAGRDNDVRLALTSPLDFTGLGLAVQVTGAQPAGDKKKLGLRISLTPSPNLVDDADGNHILLEYLGVATDAAGAVAAQFDHHAEGRLKPATANAIASDGLHHDASLELAPGDYTLKVIVRDNLHHAMGSVSGTITVR